MPVALACDGPFNGQYIDARTASAVGYDPCFWPTGERVWIIYRIKREQASL